MNSAAPETPDGYQVIDVTTGETVGHEAGQILPYSMAFDIRVPLNHHQYVIVAVTQDEVAASLDRPDIVEYLGRE